MLSFNFMMIFVNTYLIKDIALRPLVGLGRLKDKDEKEMVQDRFMTSGLAIKFNCKAELKINADSSS